ncbi:uncharacterized protein I206_101686 [Kwoniella pini CBS 10737]|uniref:Uncharacterized protein n=1 Tax=Kwoniella pini CBS 10737 TaxID=1296096 RepID=A0A1B9HW01_9TREE|nr:uncharacterized protein I206_06346 [Kwoniella pini CBS 10737]OCF47445.1 hypothetical protein I206_06346 [Kwoniella pini CBS 10737]
MFSSQDQQKFTINPPIISTSSYIPYKPYQSIKTNEINERNLNDSFNYNNDITGSSKNTISGLNYLTNKNNNQLNRNHYNKLFNLSLTLIDGIDKFDNELSKEQNEFLNKIKKSNQIYICRFRNSSKNHHHHHQQYGNSCNAKLGNYENLLKHVDMHLRNTYLTYQYDTNHLYHCQWGTCRYYSNSIRELQEHYLNEHLKIELKCIFKGCKEKLLKTSLIGYENSYSNFENLNLSLLSHIEDERKHPKRLFNENLLSLRSNLQIKLIPKKPTFIDSNLELPPYMITIPPILSKSFSIKIPSSPSPSPSPSPDPISLPQTHSIPILAKRFIKQQEYDNFSFQNSCSSSSSSSSSSKLKSRFNEKENQIKISKMMKIILPNRNEEIPFWPLCGESISFESTGTFSGSIFPSTILLSSNEENENNNDKEKDKFGNFIIPCSDEFKKLKLSIRKKGLNKNDKLCLGKPKLGVGIYICNDNNNNEKKKLKRKRIENEINEINQIDIKILNNQKVIENSTLNSINENKRFHPDQIRNSAIQYAIRKTKRSIGFEMWKEVINFENEGKYFEEL